MALDGILRVSSFRAGTLEMPRSVGAGDQVRAPEQSPLPVSPPNHFCHVSFTGRPCIFTLESLSVANLKVASERSSGGSGVIRRTSALGKLKAILIRQLNPTLFSLVRATSYYKN